MRQQFRAAEEDRATYFARVLTELLLSLCTGLWDSFNEGFIPWLRLLTAGFFFVDVLRLFRVAGVGVSL